MPPKTTQRVAGRASYDLAGRFPKRCRGIDAPLAGDDEVVAGGVEAGRVEHERSTRHELGAEERERRPETARSASTGLVLNQHKLLSRREPPLELRDLGRAGALLRAEEPRRLQRASRSRRTRRAPGPVARRRPRAPRRRRPSSPCRRGRAGAPPAPRRAPPRSARRTPGSKPRARRAARDRAARQRRPRRPRCRPGAAASARSAAGRTRRARPPPATRRRGRAAGPQPCPRRRRRRGAPPPPPRLRAGPRPEPRRPRVRRGRP